MFATLQDLPSSVFQARVTMRRKMQHSAPYFSVYVLHLLADLLLFCSSGVGRF